MPWSFRRNTRPPRRSLRESIRSFTRASRSLNDVQNYSASLDRAVRGLPRPLSLSDRVSSSADATRDMRARRVSADQADKIAALCCCDAAHAANLFFVHSQGMSRPSAPLVFNETTPLPEFVTNTTCQQLRQLDRSGFIEHEVVVDSDPTGFGFTVRGGAPAYVFSVDPLGPARKAGLRVGDFILNMNGFDVLDSSHREVAKLCVRGPRRAYIIVLSHPHLQPLESSPQCTPPFLTSLSGGRATTGLVQLKRSISRSLGSLVKDNVLDKPA